MSEVLNGQELPITAGSYQVTVDAGTGSVSIEQASKGQPIQLLTGTDKTADEIYTLGPLPDCTLTITITGDAKMYIIPL